jgi:hypothetical protein
MSERADIQAAIDIMGFIRAWEIEIGGMETTLDAVYPEYDDMKGLYKQIRARVEQAIAQAFKESEER